MARADPYYGGGPNLDSLLVERGVAGGIGAAGGANGREVAQRAVEEMRGLDLAHRVEDRIETAWMLALPLAQHFADLLALQVVLRPAQGARNDRKLLHLGVAREGSRSRTYASGRITTCLPSSDTSFGGIVFNLPPKKRLRKKRRHQVVAVVAKRDLGGAELAGHPDRGRRAEAASTASTWWRLPGSGV